MNNFMVFRSAAVDQFADEWGISLRFQAAYAPSGNGIVERNHGTMKRIAERGGITPEEPTFWYNVTPRKDVDESSVSSNVLFWYSWQVPFDVTWQKVDTAGDSKFAVGDHVWVKPSAASCTKRWALGQITGITLKHTV